MRREGLGVPAQEALEVLRAHPPFDVMPAETLQWIGERAALAYFPKGAEIVGPASAAVRCLYIVRQGVVNVAPSAALPAADLVDLVHGPGECFPVAALLGRRTTAYHYVAVGDVFVYELAEEDFRELLERSPPFHAYCTDHLAALVQRSRQLMRLQATEAVADQAHLFEPLRRVGKLPAVTCAPSATIRGVLQAMRERRIGSMVVADEGGAPVGIFTHADVVERVALGGLDLAAPISRVMTPRPVTLEASAPAHAAAFVMARQHIRHVVLVEDGKVCGIVSEHDLFGLQRLSVHRSSKTIRDAADAKALARAAEDVRSLARQLLAHGMAEHELTAVISVLNDSIVQAALRLAAARHPLPARWCWLAFGSEGRMEQTFATDQDNGLILEDGAAPEPFLPFAREVNETLDRCGFPLCKGEVMARNPRWCLPLGQWRRHFSDWIRNPVPGALLGAGIFFDFRPIGGEAEFAADLRAHLAQAAPGNPAFLRAMAENALQVRPPLGLFGGFELEHDELDLKKFGVRPFVDATRVLSLASGLPHTGTVERLQALAERGVLPADEAASAAQAFRFLQALRLRHQFLDKPAPGAENRVRPGALSSLDRRVLKEAFRHGARLQQRLRADFQL